MTEHLALAPGEIVELGLVGAAAEDVVVLLEGGEDQHPVGGCRAGDLAGGNDPVEPGVAGE